MRQDDMHGAEPATNQMRLFDDEGENLWKRCEEWLEANPKAFDFLHRAAVAQAGSSEYKLSINYLVQYTRHTLHVSIPNAIAPCLARYLDAIDVRLRGRFKLNRSAADGLFPEGVAR